jgi:putative transposase
VPLRELMDDRLLGALLGRSRDQAGGLRLTGEGSMLGELVTAVLERALAAELTAHLGYDRNDRAGHGAGNSRNGSIAKTVQTGVGPVPLLLGYFWILPLAALATAILLFPDGHLPSPR